jgi:two-component system, LytTR family, response regulator
MIVDDERSARDCVRRLVQAETDVVVIGECADGASAVERIRAANPDIVVLDVQMPERDGFSVLEALGVDLPPAIIFVTAYDRYALQAFAVHAVDYVLKPIDDDRFREAFARARDRVSRTTDASSFQAALSELRQQLSRDRRAEASPDDGAAFGRFTERLLVEVDDRIVPIRTADIDWIEASGNYVRLHLGQTVRPLRDTLGRMEAQLDPSRFARIHRSAIVNLDRIREIQPWFSGDSFIILTSGERLRLSRSFRRAFESRFGGTIPRAESH